MKYYKEIFEAVVHARGGQGMKTATEILAQAVFSEGKFVQAFPDFGPERSGAPIKTYLRVSEKPIRTREPITDPDIVVVLDETILDSVNVVGGLDRNEVLIVNSKKSVEELREKIKKIGATFEGKIHPVDANGISVEIVGEPRPNTVILGKFIKITEIAQMKSVIREFRKIFESKIGKEACEKNILAIERAYDSI